MDADFCKYMMGTARFQMCAEIIVSLLQAGHFDACEIVQKTMHEENVRAKGGVLQGIDRKREPLGGAMPPPSCGIDDPNWADDKMQELDHLRYEDKK